jgi:hypothetical protein
MDVDPHSQEIEGMILDYLRDHPRAADTVDGIAQWWILHQRYLHNRRLIESACERLVSRGLLERATSADGRTIYGAGLDRADSRTVDRNE